jgi:hypothetical protein
MFFIPFLQVANYNLGACNLTIIVILPYSHACVQFLSCFVSIIMALLIPIVDLKLNLIFGSSTTHPSQLQHLAIAPPS